MAAPLGTKVGSAFFEVVASFAGFGESLTSGVTNAITTRGLILGDAMERLGKTLFTRFTIPFGLAAAANLAQFQALERGIAETLTLFGTAPSLIDDTFGAMTKGIRDVSAEVGGLEKDIADGLYQTISAGVPKGNAFEFLEVSQMAAIADKTADLTDTVDGITTAINAYGLEFTQAAEVSDMFFATVARGKTTFGEISSTLGRVAPLAANAGVKLSETLAIMGQLTVQGLKTSEAVSFLRAAISGILRPSDEMNEIFRKVGHSSAEAAIPVIGLQAAFQTVVDAAGGSTSKLQELIGTSEGVTAILGVTGDNAAAFGSVLDSVENSAGRAADAFAIVDGTTSRSFGRMTEAFDRLGNLFGGVAAEFAQPIVDAVTVIVSTLVDMFEGLAPLVTNLASAFGLMFAVFDVPVIREIVALFAAFLISMGGILGLLGPAIFAFGILAKQIVIAGTALGVFRAATPALGLFGRLTDSIGQKFVNLAGKMRGTDFASKNLSKTFTFMGKTMQLSVRSLIGFGAGMLAATAAMVAAAAIAKEVAESLGKIDDQTLITTIGIDRLGESLGIALNPLSEISAAAEGDNDLDFAFTLQNAALLDNVQDTVDSLGEAAARDQIIGIAFQLSSRGATGEDIENLIERVNSITNLDVDLDEVFDQIDAGSASFTGLSVAIAKATQKGEELMGGDNTLTGDFGGITPQIREVQQTYADLADMLVQTRINEGPEKFSEAMAEAKDAIGGTAQEDFFIDEVLKSFNDAANGATKFSTRGAKTFEDMNGELERGLPYWDELQNSVGFLKDSDLTSLKMPVVDTDLSALDQLGEMATTLPGVIELTETQMTTLMDLRSEIDSVLGAGTKFIEDHFNTMNAQITNQMPLLTVYSGAVDQTFEAWSEGQKLFIEDLGKVTEAREQMVAKFGAGSELVDAFDSAPISQQAWLARLGPENFETALEQLLATQTATETAVTDRVVQDTEEIMIGVQTAMETQYTNLYNQASAAGTEVASLWQINFRNQSAGWVTDAATVMAQVRDVISGTIPGPTVGGVTFGPLSGPASYGQGSGDGGGATVIINNPNTSNLSRDAQLAGLYIAGAQ